MENFSEETMRELAAFFDKDSILRISFSFAVLLAVSEAGQTDNPGIIDKVRDDYLDEYYVKDNDHKIDSGGYSIDKKIRWIVWELNKKGYLEKLERGVFKLSDKGKVFLDAAPYYLSSGLERDIDQKGVLTGKAFFDLNPGNKDESVGAAVDAARLRALLEELM